jgi:trimeric autotransporter adhesin
MSGLWRIAPAIALAPDGTLAFVSGGVPVSQTFFAPTPTQQFYAFNVQPDGALATAGVPQVIPFLPLGVAASSVSISPLYLVTPANTQFGAFSFANPNSGIISPKWLQASLAVDGQGSSQAAALLVNTGSFSTSNSGTVIGAGPLRGAVLQANGSPLIHISSGVATVPDANGNNLFGGNTIDGFVLDQNQYNFGNFSLNLANAATYNPPNGSIQNTQYAFNQPVLATSLPSGVGTARSALSEAGFFGGVMECCNGSRPYALTGSVRLQTDPASSQLAATFVGTDPFTSLGSKSGLSALQLNFGSLPSQGVGHSRSTFIDNNIYAAMDSAITPSIIQANTSLGNNQTVVLPTYNSAGPDSSFVPSMTMVTAAALGPNANSWMPAGVTPCACQYLQWGYWTARIETPNSSLSQDIRNDFGSINTWIAGQPTVNMPTSGTASYNGAAIGTVNNNGANYLAAGSFNNTYNFGSNTGTVAINNFDGHNFSGTVAGSGPAYAGAISGGGSNRTGIVLGQFYGPAAAETGGTFAVQATSGPSYIASGIFAGKR